MHKSPAPSSKCTWSADVCQLALIWVCLQNIVPSAAGGFNVVADHCIHIQYFLILCGYGFAGGPQKCVDRHFFVTFLYWGGMSVHVTYLTCWCSCSFIHAFSPSKANIYENKLPEFPFHLCPLCLQVNSCSWVPKRTRTSGSNTTLRKPSRRQRVSLQTAVKQYVRSVSTNVPESEESFYTDCLLCCLRSASWSILILKFMK